MKKIINTLIIVLLALPINLQAEITEVNLAWDENSPSPSGGYEIFCRKAGNSYNYQEWSWKGDAIQGTISECPTGDGTNTESLDDTKQYYFVVRALDEQGNQSGDSNEVGFPNAATSSPDISSQSTSPGTSYRSVGGGGADDGLTTSSCFIKTLFAH